jgi:hypothetical protein
MVKSKPSFAFDFTILLVSVCHASVRVVDSLTKCVTNRVVVDAPTFRHYLHVPEGVGDLLTALRHRRYVSNHPSVKRLPTHEVITPETCEALHNLYFNT